MPSWGNLLLKDQNIENQIGSTGKQQKQCFWNPLISMQKNRSKREQVELKYLSEWKDQLKQLVADRISNLKGHFKSPKCKVLDQPDVKDTLHKLHANYVLVPADKAANNVIIVCKKYYIDTLVKELGINNVNINNPTYIPIDDSFETIMKSHNQFITSVGLEISEEDQNLSYLYWTPKLHKSPYKHRFIAGSSKCTTKDLSCLLTKVLSTIKDGLVRYCNTKTSRNGVNNMWILKNSTSLLSSLDQLDVRTATSVQTFDFSTLYTSIPHDLLKSRISNLVHNAFRKKDGSVRYTHIKVKRAKGCFTHDINGGADNMYTADNICKMIEFLIDNILCSLEDVFSIRQLEFQWEQIVLHYLLTFPLLLWKLIFRQYDQKWPQETCQVV